ncbi:MAG: hypothetical protein KUG71_05725 [Porticoccaceae bacterium]|nr:hypothetical protein [Porticoccaceae bacterium]
MTSVTEVLQLAEAWLDEIDGVEGVAQGKVDNEDCITVFISSPAAAENIPEIFHGVKVVIEGGGTFQAL